MTYQLIEVIDTRADGTADEITVESFEDIALATTELLLLLRNHPNRKFYLHEHSCI